MSLAFTLCLYGSRTFKQITDDIKGFTLIPSEIGGSFIVTINLEVINPEKD